MVRRFVSIGIVLALLASPTVAMARTSRIGGHATVLDMFPREQMTCGGGWTFSTLLNGRVPLYACVLKFKSNASVSPFGPL